MVIYLSIGVLIKLAMTEKEARERIEAAESEAKGIIERAREKAREILSEDNIEALKSQFVEKFKKELSASRELEEFEDEEMERLGLIDDRELREIAEALLEVILG